MLDTQPIIIDTIDRPGSIYKQAVASNGTLFLAVWSEVQGSTAGDIYGTRITTDGTVLDSSGFLITTKKELYAVVFDGVHFLVHTLQSPSGISITPVTSSGEVGQTTLVTSQSDIHKLPATTVLTEGKSCLAYSAWVDSMSMHPAHTWRIQGRLFNSGTNAIDAPQNILKKTGITVSSTFRDVRFSTSSVSTANPDTLNCCITVAHS